MSECPVQAPKLITAKSTVVTCGSCGAWAGRYPSFFGEDDGYRQCDKCAIHQSVSATGDHIAASHAFGGNIAKSFADMWTDIPEWDWDTVETDPPMKELDWSAIEAWYRSRGIYRVFLSAPQVEIEEVEPNHFLVTVNP